MRIELVRSLDHEGVYAEIVNNTGETVHTTRVRDTEREALKDARDFISSMQHKEPQGS